MCEYRATSDLGYDRSAVQNAWTTVGVWQVWTSVGVWQVWTSVGVWQVCIRVEVVAHGLFCYGVSKSPASLPHTCHISALCNTM